MSPYALELHRASVERLAYREAIGQRLILAAREKAREANLARITREDAIAAAKAARLPRPVPSLPPPCPAMLIVDLGKPPVPVSECPLVRLIIANVSDYTGVSSKDMRTISTVHKFQDARWLAWWLIFVVRPDLCLIDVGDFFRNGRKAVAKGVHEIDRRLLRGALKMPKWALEMIEQSREGDRVTE